jgi:regulator of sirC expression with transglutaminase-like and TPR domain
MTVIPPFADLASAPDATMDAIALALAAEFREVDAAVALQTLDALGEELAHAVQSAQTTPDAEAQVDACVHVLSATHGFTGDREHYDDPANSMLDVVLETRRGLPILLSVVYAEVGRRAGIPLAGVGLPGHFVVGHFGADPPLLRDPFADGAIVDTDTAPAFSRPWRNHEIAMRMLNNLFGSYRRRGDYDAAIRAAEMRLALPAPPPLRDTLRAELLALQARLN